MPGYWCWLHNRPRTLCGGEDGSCPDVERMAQEYRDEAAGRKVVNFNIRRLRKQNEAGVTSRELAKDIVESAKREGRDLARPSDFATQHWKANQ